jgi:hypothetical protein
MKQTDSFARCKQRIMKASGEKERREKLCNAISHKTISREIS